MVVMQLLWEIETKSEISSLPQPCAETEATGRKAQELFLKVQTKHSSLGPTLLPAVCKDFFPKMGPEGKRGLAKEGCIVHHRRRS